MKAGQLLFFATRGDLKIVVGPIEDEIPLTYVLTGMFESSRLDKIDSLFRYSMIGQSSSGDTARDDCFLVLQRQEKFRPQKIRQRRGGYLYAVDQEANANSIVLAPGGTYGETCLVAGRMGTCSVHKDSLVLYSTFSRVFRKQFRKIKSYYVGPESLELLNKGNRLITMGIDEDPLYDLKK